MKKILIILFLSLLFIAESSAMRPEKFILNCELKDGIFESSFENFHPKTIKIYNGDKFSLKVDKISKKIYTEDQNLTVLHGIKNETNIINYESFIKKSKFDWEKFKKYSDSYKLHSFWLSELVITEKPYLKYKYKGEICLLCDNAETFKVKIYEYVDLREKLPADIVKNVKKRTETLKTTKPFILKPSCKWKPYN